MCHYVWSPYRIKLKYIRYKKHATEILSSQTFIGNSLMTEIIVTYTVVQERKKWRN